MQRGEARGLTTLLRLRFGELPAAIQQRIEAADADTLLRWSERVLTAQTLDEVLSQGLGPPSPTNAPGPCRHVSLGHKPGRFNTQHRQSLNLTPPYMSVVIQVEHLSKYYRLGLIGGGTLREDVNRWWANLRGQPDPLLRIGESDHGNRKDGQLWALRDINFEVKQGEILGIIGRNGAGKSTLLKILSRITAPTEGRIKIRGRVGSLLEVGTGFHPELTGRENIYLNGTILGMTRPEVSRKLDEIVEFAEMAQFIDTPVKRYSSGMTVRLAFAVAAHLEPEILIIDEVLAVGDARFRRSVWGRWRMSPGMGARSCSSVITWE